MLFADFPCVPPLHTAVTETVPSLFMCSHFSAVFDRVSSSWCSAYFGVEATQFSLHWKKKKACLFWNTQALIFNVTHCHPPLIHTLLRIEQNSLPHIHSGDKLTLKGDMDNILCHGKWNFVFWCQYIWWHRQFSVNFIKKLLANSAN